MFDTGFTGKKDKIKYKNRSHGVLETSRHMFKKKKKNLQEKMAFQHETELKVQEEKQRNHDKDKSV